MSTDAAHRTPEAEQAGPCSRCPGLAAGISLFTGRHRGKRVLRRLKWNSLCAEVSDRSGDQVDRGDEIGHVPVTSGSGASYLEETVEALESGVGVP